MRRKSKGLKVPPMAYAAEPNGKACVGHSYIYRGREYWLHPTKGWRSRGRVR